MNKGIIQFPILLVLAVAVLAGAYYVGATLGKPNLDEWFGPKGFIITQTPTPSPSPAPSPFPTSAPKSQAIKLTYNLPAGWKTVQDASGTFEVGYDPTKSDKQLTENLRVEILTKWENNPARNVGYNFTIIVRPYDGGSRHSFIFPEPHQGWEKSDYHEKEYIYSGWSCLVLYGTYVSQSNDTWGMCAINSKQAFSFSSNANKKTVEQIIGTIKLLK